MTQKKIVNLYVPPKFRSLSKPYRYHVFSGSRGSAKSWSVARFLVAAAMARKVKILCAREFQNSISDSVHALISNVISESGLSPYFEVQNNYIICKNGSEFMFKGLSMNASSIKSIENLGIVWCEESDRISQNSLDILIPTVRSPGSYFIFTYNPMNEDDPVHKMFYKNPPLDALVQHVTYEDNPFFPDVLRKEMEHLRANDFDRYEHVWLGRCRTISDAQIFKGKYVVEEFTSAGFEGVRRNGVDFGFSADPLCATSMFVKERRLYVEYAQFGYGIEIGDIPKIFGMIPDFNRYKIFADGSRPETISFLKNLGWKIEAAKKWPGSVEDGIEFLRSFDKIVFHPRCKDAIYEAGRYSFKLDKQTNEVLPIIVDKHNHFWDACRYGCDPLIKRKATIYDAGVMT